ncbi:putative cAMP receptor [Thozetella sp. PMI_491]|nr:putative cAMP receptor [Thozetella sp. PMI_491]
MPLTDGELRNIEIAGRCASALSIVGIVTIITTFSFSSNFRNPIHRLIFINAFYNLLDVVATVISVSGPKSGNYSALCQFQGFLMQMFPVADVLWTLAMAIDVFLIVFRQYDAEALRKLELKYITVITSVTFIPALVFLFIRTPDKGPMYGSVTLWCAMSPNWVLFRIIFYYVPIWYVPLPAAGTATQCSLCLSNHRTFILITMVLYCLVGVEIFKRRRDFDALGSDSIPPDTTLSTNTTPASPAEVSVPSPVHRGFKLHDRNDSNPDWDRPSHHRSSLSFRQYVVMPLLFFVVLLAIWMAPTTNRVASLIDPTYLSYPLLIAVGATGSLRGFWNGVVYITIGLKARKRLTRPRAA